MNKLFDKNYKVFLIFLVMGLAVYANVVNGPLLFDDEHFIQKNIYVHNMDVQKIYTSSVTQGAGLDGNFYRPNQQLAYAIIYKIFGENPVPFHLLSILLHISNTFFVFLLISTLGFGRLSSLIASVIFLVHPIQTEAVSYISGLSEPMGLFFILGSALLYLKAVKHVDTSGFFKFAIASCVLYALALFSKESAVIYLALAGLISYYLFVQDKLKFNRQVLTYLSVILVFTALYLVGKFTVFQFSEHAGLSEQQDIYTENIRVRITTFLNVMPEYFKMFLYPHDLSYEKPYTAYTTIATRGAIFSLLLIAATVATVIYSKKVPRLFLALLWFFVALVPYVGIIPLNAMYLEHWIYIPIVGLVMLVALLYEWLQKKKWNAVFLIFLVPVLVGCIAGTHMRNKEWADIEKFYKNELKHGGSSVRIYNNLGMYYADKGQLDKALGMYYKGVETWDNFPQLHHNIAGILLEKNRVNEAYEEVYKALMLNPNFIYSLEKLRQIYIGVGDQERAAQTVVLIQNVQSGKGNTREQIDAVMRISAN